MPGLSYIKTRLLQSMERKTLIVRLSAGWSPLKNLINYLTLVKKSLFWEKKMRFGEIIKWNLLQARQFTIQGVYTLRLSVVSWFVLMPIQVRSTGYSNSHQIKFMLLQLWLMVNYMFPCLMEKYLLLKILAIRVKF